MNYPTYPQQQQYVQPIQNQVYGNYKMMPYVQNNTCPQVRPVSSIEEVRACPIEFDGSIFYFPDIANKKIYTKQIDLNGNVKLEEYDWVPIEKTAAVGDFVTKQEFEETMAKVKEAISQATQPQVTKQPQSKEGFNF